MSNLIGVLIPLFGTGLGVVFLLSLCLWAHFARAATRFREENPDKSDDPINFDPWIRAPYEWFIEGLSKGLPKALWPNTVVERPKPSGFWNALEWSLTPHAANETHRDRLARNPWSWPVLDLALRLAIVYPILFAALVWGLGGTGQIASFPLFPENPPIWMRPATLALISLITITGLAKLAALQGAAEKLAARLVNLTIIAAVAFSAAATAEGAFASGGAFATGGAFAGAFAGAFVIVVTAEGAVAAAIAAAIVVTAAANPALVALVAVVALAAISIALAAVFYSSRKSHNFAHGTLDPGICAYTTLIALVYCVGLFYLPFYESAQRPLVVFLVLLPLTNAVFDWLSYGATLKLLDFGWRQREIEGRRFWVWMSGFADLGIALILFLALSIAVFFTLFAANAVTGEQLFDLTQLLDDIKEDHWQVIWVIAMIGSTLVPTIIHLCFAALGFMTVAPTKRWDEFIKKQDGTPHTVFYGYWFPFEAALWSTFAAIIPVGVVALLWTYGGHLIDVYVDLVRTITQGLGFLDVPPHWAIGLDGAV